MDAQVFAEAIKEFLEMAYELNLKNLKDTQEAFHLKKISKTKARKYLKTINSKYTEVEIDSFLNCSK